jgi:hypothetical protein
VKTYIHVNQHVIRKNKKEGDHKPVITVKAGRYGRKNTYGHRADIVVSGRVVASVVQAGGDIKPLPCGAICWVETVEDVDVKTEN